ncbi:protein O-linked-mannose beta-1,2-N-acetylglucosaminyltransferase 1-like isoform X1 [Acropora muricata]|uniref:protein O-linked-mannose beta-1,2-N-acetylglucosaminyltransferase 1-like isoform X1 n=1 Tax=Acropora muricata TaxID=159855 RepID=UPI0034E462EE
MKSNSTSTCEIQIPFAGKVTRLERKATLRDNIRLLLCLVVILTFVGNIFFILETRKINSDEGRAVGCVSDSGPKRRGHKANVSRSDLKVTSSPVEGVLDIQVYSSKDNASVVVNGKLVSQRTRGNHMGINIIVLNQLTGALTAARSFDTYMSKLDSKLLMSFVDSLPEERIICFAIKDEASTNLMMQARSFIKNLGSSYIGDVGWRDMWALVMQRIRGRKRLYAEGFQKSVSYQDWALPVSIHTNVPIRTEKTVDCHSEENEESVRRKTFCAKFDGYEGVCDCVNPVSLAFDPPALADGSRVNLPVIVMASNRPQYLFRMLKTLREVQGLIPSMVTVFIDGFFDEPASVTRMFGLRADQNEGISAKNARISQHYKKSLTASFDRYPDANYLVILEEDLDVSVDILSYFHQLLPVLENDESLYCISAWNDQGYTHTAKDPAMTYRVETMPGLGWVLSRKLYKDELEAKWPGPDVFWDWDMWMRYRENRKGRECIIPDLSRTYHFGARGLNMNSFMQDVYFTSHAINTQPNVKLNVDVMYKDNYEKELERLLRQAEVLDHSKTPCSNRKDFVPFTKNKTYVLYIRMDHRSDWITWQNVARCLKIWDLDPRGYHKSLWRMWFNENHVLIVGCPASPYCGHKPAEITPVSIQNEEKRILD